jgi:nucleoside-diphosphate-sugar epimerase
MPKHTIGILGATGCIGRYLTKHLLESEETSFEKLYLATRSIQRLTTRGLTASLYNSERVAFVQCNHLNSFELEAFLKKCTHIIDLAGLAWQHPGGDPLPKETLLKNEIVQNAGSAIKIGRLLQPDQTLVWTSTSAIDNMTARLSPQNCKKLSQEIHDIAEVLLSIPERELTTDAASAQAISSALEKVSYNLFPLSPTSKESQYYSLEFSYAYSKWLGQTILEKLSKGKTRILKISDVYGPGQDISAAILDPQLPARRIQRYLAAYQAIQQKNTAWIPKNSELFGFQQDAAGNITQNIWSDWVFPTHLKDVSTLLVRSIFTKNTKTVFQVSGNRVSNSELMYFLRDYFKAQVQIIESAPLDFEMTQHSEDLELLGMKTSTLMSLETGIKEWLNEQQEKIASP